MLLADESNPENTFSNSRESRFTSFYCTFPLRMLFKKLSYLYASQLQQGTKFPLKFTYLGHISCLFVGWPGWPGNHNYVCTVWWDVTVLKMAANLNSEFWRCIDELKIQLQSLNRIEGFQLNDEESHTRSIVKPKILSRWAVICRNASLKIL